MSMSVRLNHFNSNKKIPLMPPGVIKKESLDPEKLTKQAKRVLEEMEKNSNEFITQLFGKEQKSSQ